MTNSKLLAWQKAAQATLEKSPAVPQRYGTAFHVTPPFTDVRAWPAPVEAAPSIIDNFEQLSADDKKRILQLSLSDTYLAWQVANLPHVPLTVWRVADSQSLLLQQAGLHFIFLEEGAQLTIVDELTDPLAICRLFVWQKANSHFHYTGLRIGTTFLNERLQVELLGREATANITHLVVGQTTAQTDINVAVFHKAPHTTSQVQVRTTAQDKARVIYRGLIDVDKAATGTQGYQSGRALLLSRQATVDMLPQLEIRTNDVRCSHGVNTTHLDDSALFYLQSRGLGKPAARQLAITGFFHDQVSLPKAISKTLAKVITTL